MAMDLNTAPDNSSYLINADFNKTAVVRSAASMNLDGGQKDFSVLKVADARQKSMKSPFKKEEDLKQRSIDKEEGMPDKDVSAVLVAVTRKNRLALDISGPMSADEQRTVAAQVQTVLERKNIPVGGSEVVGLKFAIPLYSEGQYVGDVGDYHMRMKVTNTGKEGFTKYEIRDLDTDFSAIFVENTKGIGATPVNVEMGNRSLNL